MFLDLEWEHLEALMTIAEQVFVPLSDSYHPVIVKAHRNTDETTSRDNICVQINVHVRMIEGIQKLTVVDKGRWF